MQIRKNPYALEEMMQSARSILGFTKAQEVLEKSGPDVYKLRAALIDAEKRKPSIVKLRIRD